MHFISSTGGKEVLPSEADGERVEVGVSEFTKTVPVQKRPKDFFSDPLSKPVPALRSKETGFALTMERTI